uniref:Uncharacterized protein n=1 Tax=Ditylenchus dipsaci TaxID=166011 RepID=A0A915EWZ9_9BILA
MPQSAPAVKDLKKRQEEGGQVQASEVPHRHARWYGSCSLQVHRCSNLNVSSYCSRSKMSPAISLPKTATKALNFASNDTYKYLFVKRYVRKRTSGNSLLEIRPLKELLVPRHLLSSILLISLEFVWLSARCFS